MKSLVNRVLVVFLLTAITGVAAMAKTKKETVTFITNMKVSGTLVKQGTYQVSFDEKTSELSILKDGKTIAKTPVRLEQRATKARSFQIVSTSDEHELVAVTFGGSDHDIVVTPSAASTGKK